MLHVQTLNRRYLEDVLQNLGFDPDEHDDVEKQVYMARVAEMEPTEFFRCWCEWNGIIGYSSILQNVLFDAVTSSQSFLTSTDKLDEERLKKLFT